MKKTFILCAAALCLSAAGKAQDTQTPEALSQKVEKFGTAIPQEKVFLHLDNTCYFVGDTFL